MHVIQPMKPASFLFLALTLAIRPLLSHAGEFKFASQTLTVPDGFVVEEVAGPPLVDRPISADFDEQGRLYVTDSSGSNEPVQQQLEEKPHRIVRLDDTNGDGRFDHHTVFADRMMFPEGALWWKGSLYVSAPPSIWRLADTDKDGVADQREQWFQGKTLTGCANDLHGPYAGPDGWIYWCKGAFAEQTYNLPNHRVFTTRAAHIFRSRLNGTGIEPVMTGGMDNPVSVAFTPGGERLLVGTFFHQPEAGKRDGIIHALYGGVYGKVNNVTDGHPKTGDLLPVMTHFGAAAPCSIIRYRSAVFGEDFEGNSFVCQFNMHKVSRHVLKPDGATFQTIDSDFLTSDQSDFHPTCVVEDADGSLLVVDTGGWYKICCPTSQLYKPDVLGAIYRIRRQNSRTIADPRGAKLEWARADSRDLAHRLGDGRPAVRDRATAELASRGPSAITALEKALRETTEPLKGRNLSGTLTETPSTRSRLAAVWTLTQIDHPSARALVRMAISDPDETVRHAAIHSAALWRDPGALAQLILRLRTDSPAIQRVAAEALGRLGNPAAVPTLLEVSSKPSGRALEHSLIYALIEIDNAPATEAGLSAAKPLARRAALIALDQMENSPLKPSDVTTWLTSHDAVVRQAASWVAGHHPEWAPGLAEFFKKRVEAALSPDEQSELERLLAVFGGSPALQELFASKLQNASTSASARTLILHAMGRTSLKEAPAEWVKALSRLLSGPDRSLAAEAVATARALPLPKEGSRPIASALLGVALDKDQPEMVRLNALSAVPGGLKRVDPVLFDFLSAACQPTNSVVVRTTAASVLAKARFTPQQLLSLADTTVRNAGPMEVTKLLAAFDNTSDPEEVIGAHLLASLKNSPSLGSLRGDVLKPALAKYPASVQQQADALLASLQVDAAQQTAHLKQLLDSLPKPDIRHGQAVFNSSKAACASCHTIGYLGGHVGPDLTNVGKIRTDRDLLESIVYPSSSFVRSFEPIIVTTRDGEQYNGVLRKDAPDEIVLATGPDTEARVPRVDIEEMRPGNISIMPAGLADQLSTQELSDLVGFLKSARR